MLNIIKKLIAGYVEPRPIALMVFNGSCNTNLFENWVEQFLIKELKAGQGLVMDNASFHKSQRTRELIDSVGCKLIFLPPYSPDLNLIEKFWANMKRWIKQEITNFSALFDSLFSFLNTLSQPNLIYYTGAFNRRTNTYSISLIE